MRVAIPGGVLRLVAFFSLFLLGCGPDFDPPSELHSLRVLAVHKDVPYAQPGDTVNLQMLWEDASLKVGRRVRVAWSGPCFDPAGDLYYGCFSDPSVFGGMLTLDQDTTSFTMAKDVIKPNVSTDPKNAPYGVAYVFFAICAGDFALLPPGGSVSFPIGCKGADGTLLGADDFVAGYTSVYSFQSFSNNNPVISGFELNGQALDATDFCLGDQCTALAGSVPAGEVMCDSKAALCVPTCADDGDPKCTGYRIRPIIDKTNAANQDEDSVSAKLLGRHVGEQMWINYYTDAGGFKSAVRLLNDATAGWNDDYGTELYAPKAAGPFRVWAVVHDNRGGVAWSGVTLQAQ